MSRRQDPLADHVGFDARLCYGDLVLSLVHRTDGDPETTESGSPTRTPVTPTEPQVIKVASVKPSPPLSVDLTVPVKPGKKIIDSSKRTVEVHYFLFIPNNF